MKELEERLAGLKEKESAMVFSTGYSANLGIVTALTTQNDLVIYDELSHASFLDAIRLANVDAAGFEHNNLEQLLSLFENNKHKYKNLFLGVEGVYSMDGDLAPLDRIVPISKKYNAVIMLDDAHGTGILGDCGSGTAEHFSCCHDIDVSMGTFSKVFTLTGGFVAADRDIIEYLKYFARPYMFSASLPPPTLAGVLAGLDLIENEPSLRGKLKHNVNYATKKLAHFEFCQVPEAAIISIKIPERIHIRKLNVFLHQKGLFLNAIEYPAVPKDQHRLRISIMANHTEDDLDFLSESLEEAFHYESCMKSDKC
jgi:glycine C-acetyltransferase